MLGEGCKQFYVLTRHYQVVTSEILMASEMQSCPIEVTKIPISK